MGHRLVDLQEQIDSAYGAWKTLKITERPYTTFFVYYQVYCVQIVHLRASITTYIALAVRVLLFVKGKKHSTLPLPDPRFESVVNSQSFSEILS